MSPEQGVDPGPVRSTSAEPGTSAVPDTSPEPGAAADLRVPGLAFLLAGIAKDVIAAADELNRLDAVAGDGDLGVTMRQAGDALLARLPELDGAELPVLLRTAGAEIARRAPSTCGTLVATGFLRAAKVEPGPGSAPVPALVELLDASFAGIRERGKAEVGQKTLLDALAPAIDALRRGAAAGVPLADALAAAAQAAAEGAAATRAMRPQVGRSAWLADRSLGHEDAGAHLVALVFASAAERIALGPVADP